MKNIFKLKSVLSVLYLNKVLVVLHHPYCLSWFSFSSSYLLITCTRCYLQYVWETGWKINQGFNMQKYVWKTLKIWLSYYFHKGLQKDTPCIVQVFQKLDGNGKTAHGALDAPRTSKRKQMGKEWMLKLRTIFHYGLNALLLLQMIFWI